MTAQEFCYWLQGFCELGGTPPTPEQWRSIRDHLALVFNKVTPAGPKAPLPQVPIMPSYEPRWGELRPWVPGGLKPKC